MPSVVSADSQSKQMPAAFDATGVNRTLSERVHRVLHARTIYRLTAWSVEIR